MTRERALQLATECWARVCRDWPSTAHGIPPGFVTLLIARAVEAAAREDVLRAADRVKGCADVAGAYREVMGLAGGE